MGSPGDYWTFFLLVEELSLRSLVRPLLSPAPQNMLYLGVWIALFLYLCELVAPWRKRQPKLREGVALDLFYTLANFLLFTGFIAAPILETAQLMFHHGLHAAFGLRLSVLVRLDGLPLWSRYALLFLANDLLSYWGHRLLHRSKLLWALHKTHHSSKQLDVLNAVRLHWGEKLFYNFFSYVPMALVGFEVQQIFAVQALAILVCLFTHANLKVPLGPLMYVVNNPQLHLWHHAAEVPPDRNVNYGSVLSVWDFLFGTARLPDDRNDLELGFAGMEEFPTTLWGQQAYPLSALLPRLWRRRR
jgi:sterol desaturase/sphingolipid hydroxylase (fatty acid hydroxylase superfamily)